MYKKLMLALAASAMALSIVHPSFSAELDFNPEESCTLVLKQQKQTAGIWAFGYLAGLTQQTRNLNDDQIEALISDLSEICLRSPDASYVSVVEQLFEVENDADGSETATQMILDSADPQSLLDKFADDSRPLDEVIISLRPTPEDVRAVFPEPMASNLLEMYEELFEETLAEEEMPSRYVLSSSTFTTTMGLADHPVLDEISGGFKEVLNEFLIDVPWGTITLDFPTIDDNVELHGMTFVNGRWVLMMRPWRGLSD